MSTTNIPTASQQLARAFLIVDQQASDAFRMGVTIEDVIIARRSSFGADNPESLKVEAEFRKSKSVRDAACKLAEELAVAFLKSTGDLDGAQFVAENGVDTEVCTAARAAYRAGYGRSWTSASEA